MNQITVRGIAPDLEKQIRRKAKATGKSSEQGHARTDRRVRGTGKASEKAGGSLSRRARRGRSEKEAREFEESVRVFEDIDQATWK